MKIMLWTYPQNVKMHYVERCFLLVVVSSIQVFLSVYAIAWIAILWHLEEDKELFSALLATMVSSPATSSIP
jgi:hypothetical protein